MRVGQFIRRSSIMFLALVYNPSCFLEISLFCAISFVVVLSDQLFIICDWPGVRSFLIGGGLVSFHIGPCWSLLSGFSLC